MKQGGRYPKLIRIKLKGNRPQSQGASDKRKNEADEKKNGQPSTLLQELREEQRSLNTRNSARSTDMLKSNNKRQVPERPGVVVPVPQEWMIFLKTDQTPLQKCEERRISKKEN